MLFSLLLIKIAFVYDRVNSWGGAERVLLALHEIWPNAPLYTAVYDKKNANWANVFQVIPSSLQNIPFAKNHHQILSLLTPKAFSNFDLSSFDITLSITSAEAKMVRNFPHTKHICYCLTPTRYLWSQKSEYEKQGLRGKILSLTAPIYRMIDYQTAQHVTNYISISSYIQKQVQKYYQRESVVIYPPVNLLTISNSFKPNEKDYYLVVSRLVSYKKVELAVEACGILHRNLVVVGTGSEEKRLKQIAGPNVKFVGHLTEQELSGYYMHCRALLFPGVEDFGIVPLEAQAHGRPVIAYGKGGVLDTVIDGKTGLLFFEQNVDNLIKAIQKFEKMTFSSKYCKENAQCFSKAVFKEKMEKVLINYAK